jgi:hypothetical protein
MEKVLKELKTIIRYYNNVKIYYEYGEYNFVRCYCHDINDNNKTTLIKQRDGELYYNNYSNYKLNVILDYEIIYDLYFDERIYYFNQTCFKKDMIREKNKEKYLNEFYNKLPIDIINYTLSYF